MPSPIPRRAPTSPPTTRPLPRPSPWPRLLLHAPPGILRRLVDAIPNPLGGVLQRRGRAADRAAQRADPGAHRVDHAAHALARDLGQVAGGGADAAADGAEVGLVARHCVGAGCGGGWERMGGWVGWRGGYGFGGSGGARSGGVRCSVSVRRGSWLWEAVLRRGGLVLVLFCSVLVSKVEDGGGERCLFTVLFM
ncbi:hypothetical protein BJ546DRAFT_147920 [Cryomyces antarcticus]